MNWKRRKWNASGPYLASSSFSIWSVLKVFARMDCNMEKQDDDDDLRRILLLPWPANFRCMHWDFYGTQRIIQSTRKWLCYSIRDSRISPFRLTTEGFFVRSWHLSSLIDLSPIYHKKNNWSDGRWQGTLKPERDYQYFLILAERSHFFRQLHELHK